MVLIVSVLLYACDPSDWFTWTFSVSQNVGQQTIPGDPVLAGSPLSTSTSIPMSDLTQEQQYQSEIFDFLEVIAITDISLTIDPSSPHPDFSFIQSISIWVGPVGGGPSSQRVAFLDPGDPQLAPGNSTIQLQTTGVNLLGLLDAGAYEIRVDVEGTVPPADVIFDGQATFDVSVGLF